MTGRSVLASSARIMSCCWRRLPTTNACSRRCRASARPSGSLLSAGNVPTPLTCTAKRRYARTDLARWAQRYGSALDPSDMRANNGDACSRCPQGSVRRRGATIAPMNDDASTHNMPQRALDALASVVEAALDRFARLDPAAPALLRQLDGRELRLRLRGAARGLRLRIGNGRVRPVPDHDGEADLGLALEPAGLVAWLGKGGADRGLPGGVRIDGDLELARLLETTLRDCDPDWELPFVDVFGSTLGPQIARGLGTALAWARRQAGELAASGAEFLTEEAHLVTPRSEVDAFVEAVDRLRDDVERLAARVARIDRDLPRT